MRFSPFLLLLIAATAFADGIEESRNYRSYNETLASAGQPDAAQLEDAAGKGFERVVYLGFTNSRGALDNEDALVAELGMQYVHIPVDWNKPTVNDFRQFASAMQADPDSRTLVHCQANYRAAVFSYLYRTAVLGEDEAQARQDMVDVWTPNETWSRLIDDTFDAYGKGDRKSDSVANEGS